MARLQPCFAGVHVLNGNGDASGLEWVRALLCRHHSNAVACALVNKLARIAWAIATQHSRYEAGPGG